MMIRWNDSRRAAVLGLEVIFEDGKVQVFFFSGRRDEVRFDELLGMVVVRRRNDVGCLVAIPNNDGRG